VLGLGAEDAGKHVPLYWGGAMVGRFLGAYAAAHLLAGQGAGRGRRPRALLLLVSANSTGAVSGWSLLAIGLVNSIMFPTIFTLASEGLGERAAEGSGLICVAIVGGAIVPLITGFTADMASLRMALAVPAICYLLILAFGWYARRPLQNC
jgi:FHS family L-fucose permease-like MFS transporter